MKRFLKYCSLFILPVLTGSIILLLLPMDMRFAYDFVKGDCSGHAKWIHDRLYENESPIDVAFIGSSVGWGAFDDESISRRLSDSLKKEITVANLSYCRPGMNMRTTIIEQLINTKSPKHIVLELRAEPNNGGHPMFGYMAETKHLTHPPTRLYQAYAKDLKHSLIVKWEVVRDILYPKEPYEPDSRLFGIGKHENTADKEMMERVRNKRLNQDPHQPATIQQRIHYYVYWQNLKYIASLCEKHNIRFSLCFINSMGRASEYPRFQNRVETIAEVWYPSNTISQNADYYSDIVHFNVQGSDALTPFLVEELLKAESLN